MNSHRQSSQYIERSLTRTDSKGQEITVPESELISCGTPAVILGEPGMGKSELLRSLEKTSDFSFVRAAALIRRPEAIGSQDLLIDALDEVAALQEGDPLHNVLAALAAAGNPNFIISCRSADWRNAVSKTHIEDDYGSTPLVWHLQPISVDEIGKFLTAKGVRASKLVRTLEKQGLLDLARNPLTLMLLSELADRIDDTVLFTRHWLFEEAIARLWFEANDSRMPGKLAELSAKSALSAAGCVNALLLLTGSSGVSLTKQARDNESLSVADIEPFYSDLEIVRATLGSRLFRQPDDRGVVVPLHRTIAEFLGARWLAEAAGSFTPEADRVASKTHALMSVDGQVPASLRGLNAWIANYPPFTQKAIKADPYGVLKYGDPSTLSDGDASQLIDSLKLLQATDPYFRAGDWNSAVACSLPQSPSLVEKIRVLISQGGDGFHLRSVLLELIHGTPMVGMLKTTLIELLFDESRYYAERRDAGEALIERRLSEPNWSDAIKNLSVGNEDSTRLAVELIPEIGVENLDASLIAYCVLAEAGFTQSEQTKDRRSRTGSNWRLRQEIRDDQLRDVLNYLAEFLSSHDRESSHRHHHWESWFELTYFSNHLIKRAIESNNYSAQELWNWLYALEEEERWNREDTKFIANFLADNTAVRREVLRSALRSQEVQKYGSLFRVLRISPGLSPTQDDVRVLFQELAERGLSLSADRMAFKALIQAARRYDDVAAEIYLTAVELAGEDEELSSLVSVSPSELKQRWKDQEQKLRRNRERKNRKREKEWLDDQKNFESNIDDLEEGELRWTAPAAKAYLGFYSDLRGEDAPLDRLASWLGRKVANSAVQGFEATLQKGDLPSPEKVANSYAEGRYFHIIHPILSGISERLRSGRGLSDLPKEVLQVAWYGCLGELIDQRNGLPPLSDSLLLEISKDPIAFEEALRGWFEPHLATGKDHVTGLYAFVRESIFKSLAPSLSLEWLKNLSSMGLNNTSELLGCSLNPEIQDRERAWQEIAALAYQRLKQECSSNDETLLWWAILFLTNFEQFCQTVGAEKPDKNLLWSIRLVTEYNRTDKSIRHKLSSDQLHWLITNFRSLWTNEARPEGTTSGDRNAWDASQFLISVLDSLADRSDKHSVDFLLDIVKVEDSYETLAKAALANQKRQKIERDFQTPSLDSIDHAIKDIPPTNSRELQSVVLAELQNLQQRIRGDSLDTIDHFYTDDRKPRTEGECLKRMLSQVTLPFGIKPLIEEAMPNGKRADCGFHYKSFRVPLEAKGQWNKHVWSAATDQLDRLYSIEHQSSGTGIYVVFWFGRHAVPGRRLKHPPGNEPAPKTPDEMKSLLESFLPQGRRDDLSIFVLDLEKEVR